MPMEVFTYVPSSATQLTRTPRVLRSQFGDGYVQETADGINADLQKWEWSFNPVHATSLTGSGSLQLIDAFFTRQAGCQKFLWTPPPPYAVQGQYVCTSWQVTYQSGLVAGIRATIEQRPPV